MIESYKKSKVEQRGLASRVALENAASIASMFLTTECVLAEKKEDSPLQTLASAGGGMGGMM